MKRLIIAFLLFISVLSEPIEFRFTRPLYNVTIPENSVGKTYAQSQLGEERIGIQISDPSQLGELRFKITSGDRDKFFKAEEKIVGDFCFLFIRTRTGNTAVLNRERRDRYLLEVRATATRKDDKRKYVLEADTVVDVTILDTNDLNPLFYPTDYEALVPEDTPVHQSILKVSAEDADLGRNGEIYYSFFDQTDQFAIHPITGIVTLTRPLKYSDGSFYELTVLGQDRGTVYRAGNVQTSRARLKIRVKQVNLYAPEIHVRRLPHIVENSNADIYAIVNVSDKDKGIHGEISLLEIVDGDPDGHFRIRPGQQKGEFNIEVLKLLDREQTPQGYQLKLRAVDSGIPPKESYKSVPVQLTDLNDNAPVFSKEIYDVKVFENVPVNTPLLRLKVTDRDEGKNAQVFLELVGGNENGEFRLNPESGVLYTAKNLDYEAKSLYSLTVSAIDQGNTGTRKQSSAKIKIYVLDSNDNDPIFDKSEMTIWLNENEPPGTSVTKVVAKDRDSGENAYISYSIVNLKPQPFEVDPFTGVIKTTKIIDYESMRRKYVLRVRASDWGLPYRRQTEMELTIHIKDRNDNRPQFEKVDCHGHLPRYLKIGSDIITLSAIDFDANNEISYRIVTGNEDNCFNLDAVSGVLSVACDLEDIRVNQRTVNITATDGTHFADTISVSFELRNAKRNSGSSGRLVENEMGGFECKDTGVAKRYSEVMAMAERNKDENYSEDFLMMPTRYGQNIHTPEFIDFPMEIKINESAALGTILTKIRARDRDLGYNGKLIFGISSGDYDSVFKINYETGDIEIAGSLDREKTDEYVLNITVYDLGKPQKSTSKVFPVLILDVNDNAPKFEKTLASFRVTENALNGTAIFRANATDLDLGENSKVTYSLQTDTKDFLVDPKTGILLVCNFLDRERQDLYELRIRATDNGIALAEGVSLYSEALVRITIDDINDNTPKFGLTNYNVRVREDVPLGTVVGTITASDPDIGLEGEVQYYLEDYDGDGSFKVDKLSGTIRTAKLLDFEERQVHLLKLTAKDQGSPSLSSKTDVTITIVDVNENQYAPVFPEPVINGSVKENAPPGTYVMKVYATDQDLPGDDSKITYSIRGGDGIGYFSINHEGLIQTLATLDAETKNHYWLTIIAQDHGVVPLRSSLQVYIEVINENDNVPLSIEPVYYTSVPEDSPGGHPVLQVRATDADLDPNQKLTFRIVGGNPEGYFSINKSTGLITTTSRRLDREHQEELILEVMISDDGEPQLSSTTRVIVAIEDNNDHAPEFEQQIYNIVIPTVVGVEQPLYQNGTISEVDLYDGSLESASWKIFSKDSLIGDEILRVLAFDKDSGSNGQITYSMKVGRKIKFRIDNETGVIYAQRGLEPGNEYELHVRASDGGNPSKSNTCRVVVQVIGIPQTSNHKPVIKPLLPVKVTESDKVGFLVALVQASDGDNDTLWYDIVDGDPRNEFYIGRDNGNILLAHQLDWESQNEYTLNISVTDGVHFSYTSLNVSVIDINDHRPEFSQNLYKIEISESLQIGTEILKLQATDKDSDGKVIFSLHAAQHEQSLRTFRLDSLTGVITLVSSLDRETISNHLLTVMVRDGGTPSQRNYARVLIIVHDHNDHSPQFSEQLLQGKVFESAEVGSVVLRALAIDRDYGENARITYSITSGNIGNVFAISSQMGTITTTRPLDLTTSKEYTLHIRATDHGNPPLSSTVPAHIMVTMADNAVPRFTNKDLSAEVFEDRPIGSFVTHVEVRSSSSVLFEIEDGDEEGVFLISPSTGVIVTQKFLDYEKQRIYNLSISATNMASAKSKSNVIIHILDKNDNAPRFLETYYEGTISESTPINSLVLTNNSDPLVLKGYDPDSEINSLLSYEIVEPMARKYFHIDSSTGAVRSVKILDFEQIQKFVFHVKLSDLGKPKLVAENFAKVTINVKDINDSPPRFSQHFYNVTLLLPTYKNVAVLQLKATDPDSGEVTKLRYDIIEGNKHEVFAINSEDGVITVLDPEDMKPMHRLQVRVSDGKFSNIAKVNIKVEESENSGLQFQQPFYTGSIIENSTKISTVCIVDVLGSTLNEHVTFKILNPTDMFQIGVTSGAIRTTGKRFDRELIDNYKLIVEARSELPELEKPRIAHVIVNVSIVDINDNCPMFVNLPYYAVVSVDDEKGSVITKVHAIDMDSGEFGEVRYELIKGNGELFKVCRKNGDIELKQNLEGHNKEYELYIAAYDGGNQPCRTDVVVHVKVIDRSMPVFKKQFYSESVPENVELHSPLALSVEAESPLGRKLIYSIVKGNELEEFALDFNTGVISVVDELDYEHQQSYELTIRATDSVSGVYAEVPVSVAVTDVNDSPPEFLQDSYNVSVSEAAPFGTAVLKVVVRDNDTGINSKVMFSIQSSSNTTSEYFHVDSTDGVVYLKQSLDHELSATHHFILIASDQGVPSLSSTAHVWVNVVDMNDNSPRFEQLSYSCGLSVEASRGQFVTVVQASDPDSVDLGKLRYSIVAGNEMQTFSIQPETGIITLMNLGNFGEHHTMSLNISVSDGVYTNFARLKVDLLPANQHSPVFTSVFTEAGVMENKPPGELVTIVKANDDDFGEFSSVTYSIHSEVLKEKFKIDKTTGEITTAVKLDREKEKLFEIPIQATDVGGRSGFMIVRVKILDENDSTPQFLLKEYKSSIHSNYTLGHIFLKIKATDLDEEESGNIEYSIYETTNSGVLELFAINQSTGGIFLLKSAIPWESQVFQFFVRARDNGKPSLFSDVPVSVLIMAPKDQPPLFERKGDKFFFSENSPPGTIITKLKMATNMSVNFRIISEMDQNRPQFSIDSSGQLSLAAPLDFEAKDSHTIGILAETDSSPPLSALTEIQLQILDENNHTPVFENNPYVSFVAENIPEMTTILKVTANDKDSGSNGEVRYSFSPETEQAANVFSIDSLTGWITNLVPLDKETKPEYKFQVTALDNGNPKHMSQTSVIIKLMDYNDLPSLFKKKTYQGAINEDALPGTVILQLETTDGDVDLTTTVTYYITSGDPKAQFQIRQTGEVYVSKSLDREEVSYYTLTVMVTDGVFTDTTEVQIEILDANDNQPYCLHHRYRHIISEGANPGTYILTIEASDRDEHSKLKYILTGEGSEYFSLDKEQGHLKTNKPLDRELVSKYSLVAVVQDRDHVSWECSSLIEIAISDLNDNAPLFSLPHYTVTLPEDVEVGTLVTKIHATDVDIGINRKIKYHFLDSFDNHFRIASDSGIVTLAKPLDREIKGSYNLTLQAVDQGTPQLNSIASLFVNVLDINDSPPEFASKFYFAVVPEIDSIDSEVVRVLATSKDIGINAEITYSIVGGNEHKKFKIDPKTGVIAISEMLDYERAKDYYLTIQATDGGTPPLSNRANVNITVVDSNDNAPVFNQVSYSARIREDAQIGDKIIQVTAIDLDSLENGRITYSLENGNRENHFAIDPTNGYISVDAFLDRETISSYVLEVLAKDNGIPQLSRSVLINLEISDVNDCPPMFSQNNYTTIVQEDKPLGYPILKFSVTDADSAPNGPPYTFDFRSGNEGGIFRLEQDGILRTATKFNHRIKDNYLLNIRVFDNGSRPLYSDTWVVVKVIEESQYPPVLTPLEISINSYLDEYSGGIIGRVYATDQDQYDTLTYSLSPTIGIPYPISELFQIDRTDGTLRALPRLDVGEYRLNVSVTDGKFYSHTIVRVNIEIVTEEMLQNAVIIRFRNVNPDIFILSHRKGFIKSVSKAMNCLPKDIVIISVQQALEDHKRNKRFIQNFNNQSNNILSNYLDKNNLLKLPKTFTKSNLDLENIALDLNSPNLDQKHNINLEDFYPNRIDHLDYVSSNKFGPLEDLTAHNPNNMDPHVSNGFGPHVSNKFGPRIHFSQDQILDFDGHDDRVLFPKDLNHKSPDYNGLLDSISDGFDFTSDETKFENVQGPKLQKEDSKMQIGGSKTQIGGSKTQREGSTTQGGTKTQRGGKTTQRGGSKTERGSSKTQIGGTITQKDGSNFENLDLISSQKDFVNVQRPKIQTKVSNIEDINLSSSQEHFGNTQKIKTKTRGSNMEDLDPKSSQKYFKSVLWPKTFIDDSNFEDLHPKITQNIFENSQNPKIEPEGLNIEDLELKTTQKDINKDSKTNIEDFDIRLVQKYFKNNAKTQSKDSYIDLKPKTTKKYLDIDISQIKTKIQNRDKFLDVKRQKRDLENDLDVLFTVKKPLPGSYYSTDAIRKALNDNLEDLIDSTKLIVEEIAQIKCTPSYCMSGVCQDRIILDTKQIQPISTDVTSFVSPKHKRRLDCICKEGFSGTRCETIVNNCAHEPCPSFKICIPDGSQQGYTCQCPDGFTGTLCDVDISKCHDDSCFRPRNPVSFSGKSYAQYRIINKRAVEEQQSLSLRIRTMYPSGNLMFAAGRVDYNILEISNGAIQYRFDLGSGEGLVRVSSVYVSDGRWHEVRLERDRNSARVTVDGNHVAHGSVPGISDVLNLQDEYMYFGAEVHQHPSILGFEDIQRGYTGCMDDVRISRMSVPLHMSAGDSSVAVLMRFANVEFSCPETSSLMSPPGSCGSQPCQNGGTCVETHGNIGYECHCHSRFLGPLCEIDLDPCASSPCLFGGKCKSQGGIYTCECVPRLSGKRCEYGRYCNPNPCKHGGVCEEGDDAPLCKCRAFTGDLCDYDLDECQNSPCANGGTCINEIGGYKCICPLNMTGLHCNIPHSPFPTLNITLEELIGISAAVLLIIIALILVCIIRRCCVKRRRNRQRINNQVQKEPPNIYLNSNRQEMAELKRGSKMSNLEVNRRDAPLCPPRPVSYTPSTHEQPYINAVVLNNLDTLRSYGSAGDELENVPPDYRRNLNRTSVPVANHSDTDSLHKPTWAEQIQMVGMGEANKIKNDLKLGSPHMREMPRMQNRNYGHNEEDPRMLGGYHWDCSDWVRRSQNPLPNITEVPGSEVPDSSSFHSNESNESRHQIMTGMGPIDPTRDIETLNEDLESEYVADSECEIPSSPGLNALNDCGDSFRFNTADSYLRHPNTYLPSHAYNIPSEAETERSRRRRGCTSPDSEVESYGFPTNRNRRKNIEEDDIGSIMLDERHSLLGLNTSNSDLSTNVCDIEDSECETEMKPLNCGVQQTSV